MQGFFNIPRSINVIHLINSLKDKSHMIISIDAEKAFDKIQHPFMIKTLQKNGHRRTPSQLGEGHIWLANRDYFSQWWKTESIPLKIRNNTRVSTFTTITQHSSQSPSYSNQKRKINKRNPNQKRRSKALTVCRYCTGYT